MNYRHGYHAGNFADLAKHAAVLALLRAMRDGGPLLVVDTPRKKPGPPRNDDRPLFDGLIWIARSGGQWEALPREFGAKSTVNDRYLEWVEYGCVEKAWARLLAVYDDEVGLA